MWLTAPQQQSRFQVNFIINPFNFCKNAKRKEKKRPQDGYTQT